MSSRDSRHWMVRLNSLSFMADLRTKPQRPDFRERVIDELHQVRRGQVKISLQQLGPGCHVLVDFARRNLVGNLDASRREADANRSSFGCNLCKSLAN